MCLARSCKYQLYSLWFHPTETQSTTLEASTAITPPMRFKFSGKYERYTCNQDWFYSSYFTDYTNQDFYNVCQLKIQQRMCCCFCYISTSNKTDLMYIYLILSYVQTLLLTHAHPFFFFFLFNIIQNSRYYTYQLTLLLSIFIF